MREALLLPLTPNEEALELVVNAIEKSKLKPGTDINICLDVAANELINKEWSVLIKFNQVVLCQLMMQY